MRLKDKAKKRIKEGVPSRSSSDTTDWQIIFVYFHFLRLTDLHKSCLSISKVILFPHFLTFIEYSHLLRNIGISLPRFDPGFNLLLSAAYREDFQPNCEHFDLNYSQIIVVAKTNLYKILFLKLLINLLISYPKVVNDLT